MFSRREDNLIGFRLPGRCFIQIQPTHPHQLEIMASQPSRPPPKVPPQESP